MAGFEKRQEELQILGRPASDDDVVESFIELVTGDGLLLKYLIHGKIAINFGNVLFCHGGINKGNIGWLPPRTPAEYRAVQDEGKTADAVLRPGAIGGQMCDDVIDWISGKFFFLFL